MESDAPFTMPRLIQRLPFPHNEIRFALMLLFCLCLMHITIEESAAKSVF